MSPTPSIRSRPPSISTADENTPLLSYVEPAPIGESSDVSDQPYEDQGIDNRNGDEDRPLPKLQVLLLCYAGCLGSIAFFSIIPYINFMIERVGGIDKEDVGFYSGLVESLFSATQMCVMILWGKVGDFRLANQREYPR